MINADCTGKSLTFSFDCSCLGNRNCGGAGCSKPPANGSFTFSAGSSGSTYDLEYLSPRPSRRDPDFLDELSRREQRREQRRFRRP